MFSSFLSLLKKMTVFLSNKIKLITYLKEMKFAAREKKFHDEIRIKKKNEIRQTEFMNKVKLISFFLLVAVVAVVVFVGKIMILFWVRDYVRCREHN